MTNRNKKLIRNSTAEFLAFTGQAGERSIARYADEKFRLTQEATPQDVSVPAINQHLKHIFADNELTGWQLSSNT